MEQEYAYWIVPMPKLVAVGTDFFKCHSVMISIVSSSQIKEILFYVMLNGMIYELEEI